MLVDIKTIYFNVTLNTWEFVVSILCVWAYPRFFDGERATCLRTANWLIAERMTGYSFEPKKRAAVKKVAINEI